MLGGTIHINEYNYCEWTATNEGDDWTEPDHTMYACHVKYRNHKGYPHEADFMVSHRAGDGLLVLTTIILTEANRRFNAREQGK